MTCPKEQEALSGTPEGLEHAASCAECAESVRLLSGARASISAGRAELTPAARARMWRNIELAEMQPRFGFAGFVPAALAAATAAAIMLLIFRPADPPASPPAAIGEEWVVSSGEVLREGKTIDASSPATLSKHGATLEMLPSSRITLSASELMLTSGALEIQLARDIALSVVTTELRVFSLGGAFAVRIDGRGTVVDVREGAAEVNGVVVHAGEERRVERAAIAAAIEPEKPAQVEPPAQPAREQTPPIERKEISKTPQPERAPQEELVREVEAPPPVIAPRPERDTASELDALARNADALRKNGAREAAIASYLTLAHRDDAVDYAEEALYRAAKILVELGRDAEAQQHLDEARARFPNGALAPERATLEEMIR